MPAMTEHRTCIIIGAGVSGLVQAGDLLRKQILAHKQIQILERGQDYGGVWAAATYPGAACDVFSILYQISWWRNPDWTSVFPRRDELQSYYSRFADHFSLRSCTSFGQNVQSAAWDESRNLWTVVSEGVHDGQKTIWTADLLIEAVGTYNRKKVPVLSGMGSFKGESWHAADWPPKYDFAGKRVAYVGTGPTSLQALPIIQPQVKSLTIYARSMTYCHPFPDLVYPSATLWTFRNIPGLLAVYAWLVGTTFGIWAWFVFRPGSLIAKAEEAHCNRYLDHNIADAGLKEKLRPRGRFGAKRPLVSSIFFDMVQRPNVEFCTEPLVRVERDGLVSGHADEENISELQGEQYRHFDVVIWGTGFQMQGWGSMIPTRGVGGIQLSNHWGDDPRTLYGTSTTCFPNFFILNGPNTVCPWASLIRGVELQAAYICRLTQLILSRSSNSESSKYCIMPRRPAEEKWTDSMTSPLATLATSTEFGPAYYYLSRSGRNTFFFPFTQSYYKWKTRQVNEEDYEGWFGRKSS